MPTSRVLFNNFLTPANFFAFSVTGGAVANAATAWSPFYHYAAGRALLEGQGTYTDTFARDYVIEVHISTDGTLANARWRWSDTGGASWNQQNLVFQNGVWVPLSFGMEVRWTDTTATRGVPQAVLGDQHEGRALREHGLVMGLDGSRDSEYRSGLMPAFSVLEQRYDCVFPVQPTAFALLDHNIPSNGIIQLKAKGSGFTDPPDATIAIPWQSGKIAQLLTSGAYRYWRVCVTLAGVPLSYLRWSELFLGASLVFQKSFRVGFQDASEWLGSINVDILRRGSGPRLLEGRMLRLTYGRMYAADQARLATLRQWINDPAYPVMRPFIFVLLDSEMSNFILCHWTNGYVKENETFEKYSDPLELTEVVRTRAA